MSEPPPLPDTDDPYALLGVPADASARDIRAAYARLIKLYRPDRAPNAFQRIHAAYEQARGDAPAAGGHTRGPHARAAAGGETASTPIASSEATAGDTTAPADPRPTTALVGELAGEIAKAAARDDHAAVDAALDRAFAAGVPIDDLVGALSDAARDVVLARDGLTWRRLIERHDLEVTTAIAALAIGRRLDLDGAPGVEAVLDDRWLADAADHAGAARLGWFAAGAVVWRRPADALVQRLRGLPRDPDTEDVVDGVELDIAAAELRTSRGGLPAEVRGLLAEERFGGAERRRARAADVTTAAARDPGAWLAAFDRLAADHPELSGALHARFIHSVWASRGSLGELPDDRFRALTGELRALGRGLRWLHVIGAAALVFALSVWLAPGLAVEAVGVGVALGGAALYLATEPHRYRRRLRPELAGVAARVGVAAACLTRWIRLNGRLAGRLSAYDMAMEADHGLHMVAVAAAWAASVADDP